jgi:hypothetical protein
MATDIGFLAAGLGGHILRIGIGRKGSRKYGESLAYFLGSTPFIDF